MKKTILKIKEVASNIIAKKQSLITLKGGTGSTRLKIEKSTAQN